MMETFQGIILFNLTFPGFMPNLLWSFPIGLVAYMILVLSKHALKDITTWFKSKGASQREAIGFLYIGLLALSLYLLLVITVSLYEPVVLYQAIFFLAAFILRGLKHT